MWNSFTGAETSRRNVIRFAAAAGVVSGLGGIALGQEEAATGLSRVFTAGRLTGDQQPQSVESPGEGAALFGLSEDESELHYVLLATNLPDVTMAHIHTGAEGEEGDVVAWLFGARDEAGEFSRPVEEGVLATGVLAQGAITSDDLVGPLEGADLQELLAQLEGGDAYVNVHTVESPGGEIRGQLREVQSANAMVAQETDVTAATGGELSIQSRGTVAIGRGMVQQGDGDGGSGPVMISYEGVVARGNTVTLTVTRGGEPLADADVYVRGEDGDRELVGQTDENGQIDVTVPEQGPRAGELHVQVRRGELEAELEVENGNDDRGRRGRGRDDDDDDDDRSR